MRLQAVISGSTLSWSLRKALAFASCTWSLIYCIFVFNLAISIWWCTVPSPALHPIPHTFSRDFWRKFRVAVSKPSLASESHTFPMLAAALDAWMPQSSCWLMPSCGPRFWNVLSCCYVSMSEQNGLWGAQFVPFALPFPFVSVDYPPSISWAVYLMWLKLVQPHPEST